MGDRAVLVELDSLEAVHQMWAALSGAPPPGVTEVVAGARTLLLRLDAGNDLDGLRRLLTVPSGRPAAAGKLVAVPVVYDGPDLDAVAGELGVSAADVVDRHTSATWVVAFLGFAPGFAYLVGGAGGRPISRLAAPRTSVPAGSVGLAADMSAVYPQSTPGGWRLIGRTATVMFDPRRPEPALVGPGDRVRFRAVRDLPPVSLSALASPVDRPGDREPALDVIEAGSLLTVQDRGRSGWASTGVARAGAADAGAAQAANRLVGNPDHWARCWSRPSAGSASGSEPTAPSR